MSPHVAGAVVLVGVVVVVVVSDGATLDANAAVVDVCHLFRRGVMQQQQPQPPLWSLSSSSVQLLLNAA